MTLFRFALITTLMLSAGLIGCGEEDPPIEEADAAVSDASTEEDGEAQDAAPDPEDAIDAGEPAELPGVDSAECMEADSIGFTPYDMADCSGGECNSCWSQSPAEKDGNCAGFYCNWTENQVLCQMERPAGACNTEADLELGCDSSIQNSVAFCAREAQGKVLSMALTQDETEAYTKVCARKKLERVISPACLQCYVDSATCAREKCLGECLAGDTRQCDECREGAGKSTDCTPAFFACTGFPDPQKLNPDGTPR